MADAASAGDADTPEGSNRVRRDLKFEPLAQDPFVISRDKMKSGQTAPEEVRFAARAWLKQRKLLGGYFSQPRFTADERWVCTCRCTEHDACFKGEGAWYQFSGSWHSSREFYSLRVSQAGNCSGAGRRKAAKQKPLEQQPTVAELQAVHRAIDALLERGLRPTASNVAIRMGTDRVATDIVRSVLQQRKKNSQLDTTAVFHDSWPAFQEHIRQYEDPDCKPLYFAEVTLRAFSYVALLPHFLEALGRLLADEQTCNNGWCMCADFAHTLCVMNFKYAVVCAVVFRMLHGVWRRTPWPLLIASAPIETGVGYKRIFTLLKQELLRRGIREPSQLNVDHFTGSMSAAKEVFPSIVVVQDVEHMRRAIMLNHKKGRRQRAQLVAPKSAAKARAKAKGKAKAKARVRPPVLAPHLENRPIWVVQLGIGLALRF